MRTVLLALQCTNYALSLSRSLLQDACLPNCSLCLMLQVGVWLLLLLLLLWLPLPSLRLKRSDLSLCNAKKIEVACKSSPR